MKTLSKRQSEIISYIKGFLETNQYAPSYREIQDHFQFSSLGSVYKHIQLLKKKGHLTAEKRGKRALTLNLSEKEHVVTSEVQLPFIGNISSEIETFPKIQTISVPSSLVISKEETYVLSIRGDSLNEELLGDGDLLIIEARQHASEGELIIAHLENGQLVVKKYYPEGNHVRLTSHTSDQPLIVKSENLNLIGVVTGMLRFFT